MAREGKWVFERYLILVLASDEWGRKDAVTCLIGQEVAYTIRMAHVLSCMHAFEW